MLTDTVEAKTPAAVSRRTWLALLAIVAVTLLTFHGTFSHQFVEWDDHAFLFRNPDLNPPTTHMLAQFWRWPYRNLYQPIPYSVWWIIARAEYVGHDGQPIEMQPLPFHLANLIAHLLAAGAVFGLLRTLVKSDWPAMFGAMLFAVHPLQVEPVNWASSFYTTLNGAFCAGALWLYVLQIAARPISKPRARWLFAGATALYVLALLSKSSAVTIPLAAIIIDWLLIRRTLRLAFRQIALWSLLAIPIACFAKLVQPANYVPTPPLWARPMVAMDSVSFYLQKLVWPFRQTIDYGRTPQTIIDDGAIWWTWIAPAILLLITWMARRKWPWMLAALLISIATLLPFLGLVKFEFQWFSTVADRYFYVPMIGAAIAVAFALRANPKWFTAPAVVVVALLMIRSAQLAECWSDTDQLMANAFDVNPQSLVANNVLAFRAARAGDDRAALNHDRAALAIRPTDAAANSNLGTLLLRHNHPADAIEHFRLAVATLPNDPQVRTNLGIALAQTGQLEEAEEHLRRACDLAPHSPATHANLAGVYLSRGKFAEADEQYRAALAIDPSYEIARRGLMRIDAIRHAPATAPKS